MKENPTLPRLQDSSYSNGHFTGKHSNMICGPINIFTPSNFAAGVPPSLAIFSGSLMVCTVPLIAVFLLTYET
jgi:hypothetical protein